MGIAPIRLRTKGSCSNSLVVFSSVKIVHFVDSLGRLVAEPLRLEYLDRLAVPEQFLLEVEGGAQEVPEDAVVVVALHLYLRLVERQVAEVPGLVGRDPESDELLVDALVGDDAEATVEVLLRAPVAWHLERVGGGRQPTDAVEGVDARLVITRAPRHHVPPLTVEFDAIGHHVEVGLLLFPVTEVGDVEHPVLLHRVDDGVQVLLSRRHILKEYAVLDALTGCQGVAHAVGAVDPRTQSVVGDVVLVLDEVAVVAATLVLDVEAEHVADGVAPVVERAQRQVQAAADVGIVAPSFVDRLEREALGAVDGLDEPHIFADQIVL